MDPLVNRQCDNYESVKHQQHVVAVGLGLGAMLEIHLGLWAFIFPLILAAFSILHGELWTPPGSAQPVVPSESEGRRHV
jgi:hypothetical protein